MADVLGKLSSLVTVGLLWGATNPLIKIGSSGVNDITDKNGVAKFVKQIIYLLTNWKYLVPLLLNQSGSVLYYYTLQTADLSMAVPIANSLTFVSTALVGWIVGEKKPQLNTFIGMGLIIIGISCYMLDKT